MTTRFNISLIQFSVNFENNKSVNFLDMLEEINPLLECKKTCQVALKCNAKVSITSFQNVKKEVGALSLVN